MNNIIIGGAVLILVLLGLIWIARPNAQSTSRAEAQAAATEKTNSYDFGTIRMAAGKVRHTFTITNTQSDVITVRKMYTSCMCTTAELTVKGEQFGPYGMPGHGAIPTINQPLDPNESATVEVVFDPAAHGPAGVGRIERAVTIELSSGQSVQLLFAAVVTP